MSFRERSQVSIFSGPIHTAGTQHLPSWIEGKHCVLLIFKLSAQCLTFQQIFGEGKWFLAAYTYNVSLKTCICWIWKSQVTDVHLVWGFSFLKTKNKKVKPFIVSCLLDIIFNDIIPSILQTFFIFTLYNRTQIISSKPTC